MRQTGYRKISGFYIIRKCCYNNNGTKEDIFMDVNQKAKELAYYIKGTREFKTMNKYKEELERNNYIESISKKYQILPEDLRRMVNNMALSGRRVTQPKAENLTDRKKARKKESGKE